jgi:hypothetical protein
VFNSEVLGILRTFKGESPWLRAPASPSRCRLSRDRLAAVFGGLLTTRDLSGQTADSTPPSVSITSPTSGATITGTVTTTADAADNTGVAGVQFQLDGTPLGAEARVAPYAIAWNTRGSKDLIFGVVKVGVGPMTIAAGSGSTKRLSVSCPGCSGDDMVSADKIQNAPGSASATFAFSTPAHYVAHLAAFKAAGTPAFRQGATATSNSGSTSIAKAFNSAVTSGSLLVVAVAWSGSVPLTVTDNRNNVCAVATSAYDATLGQSVAILRGQSHRRHHDRDRAFRDEVAESPPSRNS